MKRLNIFLSGLALCSLMLSTVSCDLDQELPPIAYPDGGSAENFGNGSWDNPYRVWQVLTGTDNGTFADGTPRESAWVTGYIVGYITTSTGVFSISEETAIFSAQGAEATNIIMAESPDERNWEKCMSVQLPTGAVRNAVNLQGNPGNLGKEITLFGSLGSKYMGAYGLRSCSAYEWGSEGTPGMGEGSGGNGGGSVSGGTTYLVNGLDGFTIENAVLPAGVEYVWAWDSQYGAKASAFVGGSRYVTDSYLVSPEITLSSNPTATFSQALNYLNGANRGDFVNVCVREGKTGEWTTATVSTWPDGTSWTFIDNCAIDLSAFAGKTVQIAFRYQSTSSIAPTWEVKRLTVGSAQ